MKTHVLTAICFCISFSIFSQYQFDPSFEHPYGLPNPEAPKELLDFAPLIGECNCSSIRRKPDRTWAAPVAMKWRFKYIMNGMAVQDETLKEDGSHGGSIRQFIPDSTRWYVHYYNTAKPSTLLPVWEGNKNENGNIVLYREQKAPNGVAGNYRLTFSEISAQGYKWTGEWVSKDGSIVFPTWKIDCTRPKILGNEAEKTKILAVLQKFSQDYMEANYNGMLQAYTADAKIFPTDVDVIEGHEAIKNRWMLGKGAKILHHKMTPVEINFLGAHAYDYGYYEGKTKKVDGSVVDWKGKYVVVWKKQGNTWKMYLDIWNRMVD
ncbi:YybH family protein [Spongiimicrobium sp. 3-5]|uniref:YybH family protein n=1 Tax=Spongiimicrobium sp. 3-5 TaxID=3332596 RepID=UPI00397F1939